MHKTTINPVAQNQRTAIVDILRGWALFGVVIMNYIEFTRINTTLNYRPQTDAAGHVTFKILDIFFESKSWTLLSVLFGYGFAVLIDHLQKKGYNPLTFFSRRMFWLFVLALLNSCFFFGDILKDYAFMGLLFLLFYRSNGKSAFITALVIIFATPAIIPLLRFLPYDMIGAFNKVIPLFHSKSFLDVFSFNLQGTYFRQMLYPFYLIICHLIILACMLLGFSAYKYDIFNRLSEHKKYVKRVFWYSLAVALFMQMVDLVSGAFNYWNYTYYYQPFFIEMISTMVCIASGICWLYISGKCVRLFRALKYGGRMTLSNYIVQNIISLLVFSGAGLEVYDTWHPVLYVVFAACIYFIQLFISRWWLHRYNYGPVEWLWRQLSYGRRLPIRKNKLQPEDGGVIPASLP